MVFDLKLLEPPADAEEGCYIETEVGVAAVLRRIASDGSRVAAYLDEDTDTSLHTVLLAVEPPAVVFAKGADHALNGRLLKASGVTFVTSDQGVPVQFTCPEAHHCEYEGKAAFEVELPARVLRLQRRNYYRLPGEPVHVQLKCELVFGPEGESVALNPQVLDLSCGGLAAALAISAPDLQPDQHILCSLELPALGKVESAVQVRAVSDFALPTGQAVRRYGLEFLDLSRRSIALLERFIFDQQRQRKKVASL